MKSSSTPTRRFKRRVTEQLNRAKEPLSQIYRNIFNIKLPPPPPGLFNKVGSRKNITLFLIYQPNGIDSLTKRTLSQLQDCNTDAYIISNGPIPKNDALWINSLGFSYGERKNIGYDFGGYRDGILWLTNHLQHIDQITILNDSSIMPLKGTMNDLYRKVNALNVDFTGLIEDIKAKPNNEKQSRLPSYFWSFNAKAIYSETFQRFWNDYEPTSSKKLTVSRGEWAFNRLVAQTNLTKGAIYDYKTLIGKVQNAEQGELMHMLKLFTAGKKSLIKKIENLEAEDSDLSAIRQGLTTILEDNNHSMLCSLLLIEYLNFPSLKRKALKSHPKARNYFEHNFEHLVDS